MLETTVRAEDRYGCDIDLFSHQSLLNPYPDYKAYQDIGRIAYMRPHSMWIVTRYDEVKQVLANPATFCSQEGVGMSVDLNTAWKGFAPMLDGADHAPLRQVMMQTLGPRAALTWQADIEKVAARIVDEAVERGECDGAVDIAQMMPMLSVVYILGLDPDLETRRNLLHWATDTYDVAGPEGSYAKTLPSMGKLYAYALENCTRDKVRPGSVGDLTYQAVDKGQITEEQALGIVGGYFTAGLDTTASGIGNMLMLLARNPDQWQILREDPSLIQSAFLEAVRLESPAQWFTRVTTKEVSFDDVVLPKGTRLMHSYGAANRDVRHYPDPDRFDVRRNPADNMAFGHGVHTCMGKWLSNLEVGALFGELVKRVETIELVGEPVQHINNIIRSLDSLPIRLNASKA